MAARHHASLPGECRRRRRNHNGDHDAFQVERVANMRCAAAQVGWGEKKRIDGFEQRMKAFEAAALRKQGFEIIEERA
jgi:hypothetical protein